jgi:DNA-binding CsgD family transcriptional regulator
MILGRWDEAEADLLAVMHDSFASPVNLAIVLPHLARMRLRRGDPNGLATAEEGVALALPTEEAQLIVPAQVILAEGAWLAGDLRRAAQAVQACLPYEELLDHVIRFDVLLMARRAGVDWQPGDTDDEAIALLLAGDHGGLARFWEEHGYVYDAADAAVDSDDVDDVQRAYEQLMALGARPRANHAAKKLRELGARVARGPRASTQANAAGLTSRELEVATLLAEGLTNTEIADRLIVSAKTVDHHVSAILTKLGVTSRRHVGRAAAKQGVDLGAPVGGA